MAKLRLLIADDQPLMRAGFRAVLEATGEMEVVAEAGDGVEAVARGGRQRPDVVLMDIRMPHLDGIEATRRLAGHRVLILTTFGLDEYIIEALRAGASGFILKDVPTDRAGARGARDRRRRRAALAGGHAAAARPRRPAPARARADAPKRLPS